MSNHASVSKQRPERRSQRADPRGAAVGRERRRQEQQREHCVEPRPGEVPLVRQVVRFQRLREPEGPRKQADPDRGEHDHHPPAQRGRAPSHRAYTVAEMTTIEFEAVPAVVRSPRTPGLGGDEVRRHLGGRHRQAEARRRAPRRRPRGRHEGGCRPVRDGQDDRRPDPARPRGLVGAAPARVRHARLDRRADLERALRDGDPRPRPRGGVVHRLAGGHRHRRQPHQGEDRRGARRADPRRARRGQDRARRRLPGRLDLDATT